jgi:hypothetical protein
MLLPKSDKEVFILLRDRKITYAQFESKVYKMNKIASYVVLDDIIDDLADVIK